MDKTDRLKNIKNEDKVVLNQYLKNLEQQNKSKNTIKSYENDLIQFLEWLNLIKKKDLKTSRQKRLLTIYLFYQMEEKSKVSSFIEKCKFWILTIFLFGLYKYSKKTVTIKRVMPLGVNSKKRHTLSCIKNFFEFLKQSHEGKSKKYQFNPVKDKLHGIKLKEIDIEHTYPLLPNHWQSINDTLYRVEE